MSYLEAMAMGKCVVAADVPTAHEYITHNVNGLLYQEFSQLDYSNFLEIGRRSREHIEIGYDRWLKDEERLIRFITTPTNKLKKSRLDYSFDDPLNKGKEEPYKNELFREKKVNLKSTQPLVTVITVVKNARKSLEETIQSVLSQDYVNLEYIIIDGKSSDGTLEIIKKYEHSLSFWSSEEDLGIYDAIHKGIQHAKGEWFICMHAGDSFVSSNTISNVFRFLPKNVGFIIGHYFIYHRKNPYRWSKVYYFEDIWKKLLEGELYFNGNSHIPCHQATFTRTELFKKNKYNFHDYPIAADHHFMFSQKKRGVKFYHCGETIAFYQVGDSRKLENIMIKSWTKIAYKFTKNQKAKERASFLFNSYLTNSSKFSVFKEKVKKNAI